MHTVCNNKYFIAFNILTWNEKNTYIILPLTD